MRLERVDPDASKGWLAGPWESTLPVSIGFAHEAINEPHVHTRVTEIFLIAQGSATARVLNDNVPLNAGDMLIVEPGEAHTMLDASDDFRLFVLQTPGLAGAEAVEERLTVSRTVHGL